MSEKTITTEHQKALQIMAAATRHELLKMAKAIYLATDEKVADDISTKLEFAASVIDRFAEEICA